MFSEIVINWNKVAINWNKMIAQMFKLQITYSAKLNFHFVLASKHVLARLGLS